MARNKAELRGLNPKRALDIGVSLARRLMMLHAVRAEATLEKIDNAAMLKLAGLHLKQIVGEREQPMELPPSDRTGGELVRPDEVSR